MSLNAAVSASGAVNTRRVGSFFALTFLVPGLPQFIWGQPERAFVLAGTFLSALTVGLFAWGTLIGIALLLLAYVVHVASVDDAIHQWSFPAFDRRMPRLMVSLVLGVGVYGPLVLAGSILAWPAVRPGQSEAYLVNRCEYQEKLPESGDWIWLALEKGTTLGRLVEVVAKPGQNVEWSSSGLRINGKRVSLMPFPHGTAPKQLEFQVPEGQLLVAGAAEANRLPRSWEFVPIDRVEGRAWAKLYPVWDRRILD